MLESSKLTPVFGQPPEARKQARSYLSSALSWSKLCWTRSDSSETAKLLVVADITFTTPPLLVAFLYFRPLTGVSNYRV